MSRSRRARWWHAAGWCAAALLVATGFVILRRGGFAAPMLALLLFVAYLCSPLCPRANVGHWAAQQRHVRHATVVVYWRPGCMFCGRLRFALWRAGVGSRQVDWVDIWEDREAAAYVRDLNDGSETVPTVILPDGSAHTNPEPARVIAALRGAADSGGGSPAAGSAGTPGPQSGSDGGPSTPAGQPTGGQRPPRPSPTPGEHRPHDDRPHDRRPGRPRPGVSRGSRGGTGAA